MNTRKGIWAFALVIGMFTGCTGWNMLVRNVPGVRDYGFMPSVTVQPATQPFRFTEPATGQPYAWQHAVDTFQTCLGGAPKLLVDQLNQQGTIGLVVIHRDTVKYQHTWHGYTDTSLVTSFSVAKAFVVSLVGFAVQDGFIKNIDQPITDFLPELARKGYDQVTIRHLMQMTSSINRPDNQLSFLWEAGTMYYTPNLERTAVRKRINYTRPPGTYFDYLNTNTQLLGMVLERATHQPLERYFQQRLWQPLGAERPLVWSTDRPDTSGMPKAFCCLNARMLDYAKFGRLYMHMGNWNGQQLLDTAWVHDALGFRTDFVGRRNYRRHWWPSDWFPGMYMTAGLYGQYIIIVPELDLLVVHFAKQNSTSDDNWYLSMDHFMAALPLVQQHMSSVTAQWPCARPLDKLVPGLLPDSVHDRRNRTR